MNAALLLFLPASTCNKDSDGNNYFLLKQPNQESFVYWWHVTKNSYQGEFYFSESKNHGGIFLWVLLKHLDDHMELLVVPWDHAAMKSDHYLPSDSWSLYTIRKFSDF